MTEFNKGVTGLQGMFAQAVERFTGSGGLQENVLALAEAVETTLGGIAGVGGPGVVELGGGWLGQVESALNAGLDAIGAAINTAGSTLPGQLETMLGTAVDQVTVPNTRWIGQDIVEGIAAGMKSRTGDLVGALQDVIDAAVSAATAALGIASPSRVFMDYGEQIAAGMALGITQGTPGVLEAVNGMVGGMGGGLSLNANVGGMGGAAPARAVTNETHLHVGVLVADEAGLRELERKLRPVREQEDERRGLV